MTEVTQAPERAPEGELRRISHWIGGRLSPASPAAADRSTTRRSACRAARSTSRRPRRSTRRSRRRGRRSKRWRSVSLSQRQELHVPGPPARERAAGRHRGDPHRRARQGALRRTRRGAARARGDRARLRDPDAPPRPLLRAGLDRDRRLLDPAAARRRGRDHALQLPGDGAHVDVGAGDRLREHVHPQAVREGPLRIGLRRRAAPGGRDSRRRLQRRPRRQGGRRRDPRASGHRRRQLRRLDADREAHLHDRDGKREARAGARRREEPHGRAPGRGHRDGGRRGGQRGLRLGRRAVHGDLGGGCGRRRGRSARRGDQGAPAEGQGRAGDRARLRDGPVDHARAPRQGRLVHRPGPRPGRDGGRGRARDEPGRRRLLPRRLAARPRDAGDGRVQGRDLRPGALGRPRRDVRRRGAAW